MGTIRFLLALHVLISHMHNAEYSFLGNGTFAVELFFICSGYYMFMIWTEKYSLAQTRPALNFYLSRGVRIYPLYWLSLILVFCTSGIVDSKPFQYWTLFPRDYTLNLSIDFSQFFLFGQDLLGLLSRSIHGSIDWAGQVFNPTPSLSIHMFNPPAWSLASELLFYLAVPVLAKKVKTSLILLLASALCRVFFINNSHLQYVPWVYSFFPCELMLFLLGGLTYVFFKKPQKSVLQIALFAMIFTSIIFLKFFNLYRARPLDSIFYIFFALSIPSVFEQFKNSRLDQFLGNISFPIYILHYPIIRAWYAITDPRDPFMGILLIGFIIFAGACSYIFIEKPITIYRHKKFGIVT